MIRTVWYFGIVFVTLLTCTAIGCWQFGTWDSGNVGWILVQTVSSCLMVSGWAFLLGRTAVVAHLLLFAWIAMTILIGVFLRSHFAADLDTVGNEWLMVLINSSWSEIGEFVRVVTTVSDWALILVVTGAFAVLVWVLWWQRPSAPTRRSLSVALAFCVPFVVFNRASSPYCDCLARIVCDPPFVGGGNGFSCYQDLSRAGAVAAGRGRYVGDGKACLGVFVIGESATRRHWSLYGYGRSTTPSLEAIRGDLVVFDNVRADAWLTTMALRSLLTDFHARRGRPATCSLASAARSVGYETVLLSGQNHWGHVDGADALVFAACNRRIFLSDLNLPTPYYDDALMPLFSREIVEGSSRKALFVHLLGSHLDYRLRCPPSARRFVSDGGVVSDVDAYDDSIAFTDVLLGKMLEELRTRGGPSFLLYVSDHGETPGCASRSKTDELFEVPMVIWFSPDFLRLCPHVVEVARRIATTSLTSDDLYPLFLDLLGISPSGDMTVDPLSAGEL